MARKNLLAGLAEPDGVESVSDASAKPYPMRGASKSMIRSVSELAKQADAYLEGEKVVEIDPDAIDVSFVADRMGEDPHQYQELLEAIRERGQDSPILARPNPRVEGRYMVVFGHRRVRAARELGRKVRAVVKVIDDKTHVIAQGQENSARANLTFIERAAFAKRLEDLNYERDIICSALAANAAAVSKMISVMSRVPEAVVQRIGAAPMVGRERWVKLSLLVGRKSDVVDEVLSDSEFDRLASDERFELLFARLNAQKKSIRKSSMASEVKSWCTEDKAVGIDIKRAGKTITLSVKEVDGDRFGTWISDNLDGLYDQFRKSRKETTGD